MASNPLVALSTLAAALPCVLAAAFAAPAFAQQGQPARAAAAPAPAAAASAARGFGSARGPILTRDELRACFAQDDDLKKRAAAQEAARGPLEQEKAAIGKEQETMKAERARVDGGGEISAGVAAFNERNKAFDERRARWEARVKAYKEAGRGAKEEEGDALNAEATALQKEQAGLEAERKRLLGLQDANKDAVQAYNVRVRDFQARVAAWDKRTATFNEANAAIESDRLAWTANCGNRRYREEDEMAIRAGK